MPRVKLSLLLGSLLLLQIVTIEAQKINLVKTTKCMKTALELTGVVADQIVPVIKTVIECVKFEVKINTNRMTMMQLVLLVYQFLMYALNNRLDCLTHAYLSLAAVMTPHTDTLSALKCFYLFVAEPLC